MSINNKIKSNISNKIIDKTIKSSISSNNSYYNTLESLQTNSENSNNNSFLLNGASSFYYFTILDKKILLIGDRHILPNSKSSLVCPKLLKRTEFSHYNDIDEKYDILDLLLKIIDKNKNTCLDLFIESAYDTRRKSKYHSIKNKPYTLLDKKTKIKLKIGNSINDFQLKLVRDYFDKRCLGKRKECISGLRYHSTDLLQMFNLSFLLSNIQFLFIPSENSRLSDDINCSNSRLFSSKCPTKSIFINLLNYLFGLADINTEQISTMISQLLDNIYSTINPMDLSSNIHAFNLINRYIKVKLKNKTSPELLKLKKSIIKQDIKFLKQIRTLMLKQINNLDNRYLKKQGLLTYFMKTIDAYYNKSNYFDKSKLVRHILMEVYTIARMFRKFEKIKKGYLCDLNDNSLKNIIYYAGDEHIINIKNFLKKIFKIKPIISIDETIILDKQQNKFSFFQQSTNSQLYNQCLLIPKYINSKSYLFNIFRTDNDVNSDNSSNLNNNKWTKIKSRTKKKR